MLWLLRVHRVGVVMEKSSDGANSVWTVHRAPRGRLYYFNSKTKKSSWECPPGMEGVKPVPKKKKSKRGSRKRKRKEASHAVDGSEAAMVAASSSADAVGKRRRVTRGKVPAESKKRSNEGGALSSSAAASSGGASRAPSPAGRPEVVRNPYESMTLDELRVLLRSGDLVMERMASLRQVIVTYLRKAPGDAATVVRSLAEG